MTDKLPDIKELLKTIKVPKDGATSKNHVIINPPLKDDDEKSNTNPSLAAKTISAKLSDKFKVAEGVLPPKIRSMTGKKTAIRHVNRRYVPAHSVQRALQGRSLPTAGIQASSTRNESMKTSDSQGFPQGPVDDAPQDPVKFGRSLASKSMATLKQDLSYALANKDAPGQSVEPDGPVKDQLLGAPYNKNKDLSVDDLDMINKEIGVKLDA